MDWPDWHIYLPMKYWEKNRRESFWMIRQSPQILRCISCELSCQLFPDSAVRVQYCNNAAFAIWPDGNVFLKKALLKSFCLIIKIICPEALFSLIFLSQIFDDSPIYNGLTGCLTAACISFWFLTEVWHHWLITGFWKAIKYKGLSILMTMIQCNSRRYTACLPVASPTANVDDHLTIRNLYCWSILWQE